MQWTKCVVKKVSSKIKRIFKLNKDVESRAFQKISIRLKHFTIKNKNIIIKNLMENKKKEEKKISFD